MLRDHFVMFTVILGESTLDTTAHDPTTSCPSAFQVVQMIQREGMTSGFVDCPEDSYSEHSDEIAFTQLRMTS